MFSSMNINYSKAVVSTCTAMFTAEEVGNECQSDCMLSIKTARQIQVVTVGTVV